MEPVAAGNEETIAFKDVAAPPPNAEVDPPRRSESTPSLPKTYEHQKLVWGLVRALLGMALLAGLVATGATQEFERLARTVATDEYAAFLVFVGIIALVQVLLFSPLRLYTGFILEHRYGLSRQTFGRWVWEGTKGVLVGTAIALPIMLVFLFCIKTYGPWWWIPVSGVWLVFSVVLARLAPLVIFPLFYRFKPLDHAGLQQRIKDLSSSVGLTVQGVFVFDLSKNTKKANAAMTGIGGSRRIVLSDTLVANFTDDEIASVFAHELGHYAHHHIRTGMMVHAVVSVATLFVAATLYAWSIGWMGGETLDRMAMLPLIPFWLAACSAVTGPFLNAWSRRQERVADAFAVESTGRPDVFANALRKLAKVNLADPSPHPAVEFLFHSHPSIEKRIAFVEGYRRQHP